MKRPRPTKSAVTDMMRFERLAARQGACPVAGLDEAGRGPLAGPVVAAAAVLPANFQHDRLTDSKQLTAQQRDQIYTELTSHPNIQWGCGSASVDEIATLNILRATWLAMQRALDALPSPPDHVLVDGLKVPILRLPQTPIVGGDALSFSIAAASVIAKVTRDRIMLDLHHLYPQYNFAQHKGYATHEHLAALTTFGPSPVHRKTFSPVQHATQMVQLEMALGSQP